MSGPSATTATSSDIFAVQDEISEAIVTALKLTLLPEEKKAIEQRGTNNVEAYDKYLRARALLYQSGPTELRARHREFFAKLWRSTRISRKPGTGSTMRT